MFLGMESCVYFTAVSVYSRVGYPYGSLLHFSLLQFYPYRIFHSGIFSRCLVPATYMCHLSAMTCCAVLLCFFRLCLVYSRLSVSCSSYRFFLSLNLVCFVYIISVHSVFGCMMNKNYYNGTCHCRHFTTNISNTVAQ